MSSFVFLISPAIFRFVPTLATIPTDPTDLGNSRRAVVMFPVKLPLGMLEPDALHGRVYWRLSAGSSMEPATVGVASDRRFRVLDGEAVGFLDLTSMP